MFLYPCKAEVEGGGLSPTKQIISTERSKLGFREYCSLQRMLLTETLKSLLVFVLPISSHTHGHRHLEVVVVVVVRGYDL